MEWVAMAPAPLNSVPALPDNQLKRKRTHLPRWPRWNLPTGSHAATLGVRWNDLHRLEVTVILTGSDESKPHELPRSEGPVTLGLNHRENSPHPLGVSSEGGFAAAIMRGDLDGRRDEVIEVLVRGVAEKLAVANPPDLRVPMAAR